MMDDLISRKDVLHELDWCDYGLKDWQKWKLKMMVRDIPSAEPERRWIPCSERMPEKGKVVLITNDKGNVRCGQYRGLWSANGNVTQWTFRGNVIETVVAWMPLPEPARLEE